MLQAIPVPVGRVSLKVADVAAPGPPLLTASVYPMEEPACTVAESAVFVIPSDGHCTVVVAEDCTEFALAAPKVAVFV
jgi:hypothetical protein